MHHAEHVPWRWGSKSFLPALGPNEPGMTQRPRIRRGTATSDRGNPASHRTRENSNLEGIPKQLQGWKNHDNLAMECHDPDSYAGRRRNTHTSYNSGCPASPSGSDDVRSSSEHIKTELPDDLHHARMSTAYKRLRTPNIMPLQASQLLSNHGSLVAVPVIRATISRIPTTLYPSQSARYEATSLARCAHAEPSGSTLQTQEGNRAESSPSQILKYSQK
jgi:hypothetical protein